MPFVFRRTPSVNHLRLRLRRRRHLRHRFRLHRHQPDCPNYPMRNGRRRSSRGSRRGRRHTRRRPLRSCRSTIGEVRGGSAIASSLRSRSATCRRPRSRVPSSRSSSFPLAPNRMQEPACAPQKLRSGPHLSPNAAIPFIDHSSEMWNFHSDGPLCRCPCSMRKVKP